VTRSGVYRTGGAIVAYVLAEGAGHTAETVADALADLAAPCARCGREHWLQRSYLDADALAAQTGRPRREVRRACERLTAAGVLDSTGEAWRLSQRARELLIARQALTGSAPDLDRGSSPPREQPTMPKAAGPEQGETPGPGQGDPDT